MNPNLNNQSNPNNKGSYPNNDQNFTSMNSNPNLFNLHDNIGDVPIIEVEEQNLLDEEVQMPLPSIALDTPNSGTFFNTNFFVQQKNPKVPIQQPSYMNQALNQPFQSSGVKNPQQNYLASNSKSNTNIFNNEILPSYGQSGVKKPRVTNQRLSQFDQELMELLNQANRRSQIAPTSKASSSQLEAKNRKAMSRLSQQFYTKPAVSDDMMKSKKKSRKTIAFPADMPKDFDNQKDGQSNFHHGDASQLTSQPEKIEIQTFSQVRPNTQKQTPANFEQNVFMPRSHESKPKISPSQAEIRLSQVKKNRHRLSLGMQNLMNVIKSMQIEDKPKKQKAEKQKKANRFTADYGSLTSILMERDNESEKGSSKVEKTVIPQQFGQNQQIQESQHPKQKQALIHQIQQKPKHFASYTKPVIRKTEQIIPEDSRQDDFTPLKQIADKKPLQQKRLESVFQIEEFQSINKILQANRQKQDQKRNYTKQVFDMYFTNIADKIAEKRRQIAQLRRQKQEVLKSNKETLSMFYVNAQMLAAWKHQEQEIRGIIYNSKQKVSKAVYNKNRQFIEQFEMKLGIQLHTLEKQQKIQSGSHHLERFFTEFTYQDILYRIRRNQKTGQFTAKFVNRPFNRRNINNFRFSHDEKLAFIQPFLNKRLKKVKTFLHFMVNFIRYLRAIEKFELTIEQFVHTSNIRDLQLSESKPEIEFYLTVGKFEFLFVIEMIEMISSGGIRIFSVDDKKDLQIPVQYLEYNDDGNKLAMCILYAEKYPSFKTLRRLQEELQAK